MSLDLLAKYWNAYLSSRVPPTETLKPHDISIMLDLRDLAYRKPEEKKIFEKHDFVFNPLNLSSHICQLCGNSLANIIHT